MLSYRHAYHAGNHADVLKHVILIDVLRYLSRKNKGWSYIDTHAGAGCYALDSERAGKTAEYLAGVGRLWEREDVPEAIGQWRDAVRQFNPQGSLRFYPGSPALAMTRVREQDRMRLFELHPADFEALEQTFAGEGGRVRVSRSDGMAALRGLLPPPTRRALVLIDPSYEVKQDYNEVVRTLADAQRRFANGTYMVWYPMLTRPEARRLPEQLRELGEGNWLDARLMVREPPREGHGMFGSGVFIINPPFALPGMLEQILPWLADVLGEGGAGGFDVECEIA